MCIYRHLHLELRKISCEIDTIFGKQMTFNMACYFAWVVIDLRELFYTILVNNYVKSRIGYAIDHIVWLSHDVSKILLINYMCETVTIKVFLLSNLTLTLHHDFLFLALHYGVIHV